MHEPTLTATEIASITAYVDVHAPPVGPTAYMIFGTNQEIPVRLVVKRYRQGLAPLIIATGGVNRHNGVVEGREFRRQLLEAGVSESVIRYEDQSVNTWQNVELALPHLREATESGLPITGVCKWFHRRAIHCLRTLLPDVDTFHAVAWEPIYSGTPITRTNWPSHPDGNRRVIREWREVQQRVADGSFKDATLLGGAWR